MEFSTRLKLLRKEKGFTQSDVARMVFIDKTAVSKWELGLNFPNQNIQTRLADLFGVSVDYLLGRTDIRNANLSPPAETVVDMPVVGSVRAGMDGNIVSDDTGDTRRIAAAALHGRPDEYFLLRVRGDSKSPLYLRGFCVDNNCIVLYNMNGCATHASGCCPDCVGAFMVSAQLFLA